MNIGMSKHLIGGFLILFFPFSGLLAQSTSQSIYQSNINVSLIPPAPTAASFQKYGITPVAMQNGLPDVNIPVYEVKTGDLSIPITLSYHNNGLKTQEEAGWVGLGWNLNAGGVISRILKGSPDGSRAAGKNFDQINAYDSAIATTPGDTEYAAFLYQVYANQTYDVEPDIFVYNFPGHSGKFMYIGGKPRFFDYERLNVIKDPSDDQITITDDNGTTYLFNKTDITRTVKVSDPRMVEGYVSAWQLAQITSADGMHWISFSYVPYTYYQGDYVTGQTYSLSFGEYLSNAQFGGCLEPTAPTPFAQSLTNTQSYDNQITGWSLSSISTSDNQTISFIQSDSVRQDVASSENPLSQIVVYGKSGDTQDTVIKRVSLSYGYFTNATGVSNNVYNRLKLKSVYMENGVGDTLNAYGFQYYHEYDAFPSKNTFETDAWGYYNLSENEDPSSNGTFIPELSFPTFLVGTTYTLNIPYANRSPDSAGAEYGVLSQINYPTGGYTDFQYQQNTYYNAPISYVQVPPGTGLTVYYGDNPSNPTGSGTINIDHQQYMYINYFRDLDSGINLPYKGFTTILTITQCTNCVGNWDTTGFVPVNQTVYSSPELYTTNSMSDSLYVNPGVYTYTLTCQSTLHDVGAYFNYTYTVKNYNGSPAPGLRVSTISDFDGISATPVLQKNYIYRDTLGYTSGVLVEDPPFAMYSSYAQVSGAGACSTNGYIFYNFPSDNNAVYNANLNFHQYYGVVREYVSNPQDTTKNYYTEHYFAPVLGSMAGETEDIFGYAPPGEDCTLDNIVLTDPVEVGTVNWKTVNGKYIKTSQTSTVYNDVIDTIVTGVKPRLLDPFIQDAAGQLILTVWMFNQSNLYCLWKYPMSKQEILYDDYGNSQVKNTTYTFDPVKRHLSMTEEDAGNGRVLITKYKYPDDYSIAPMTTMASANVLSPPVETQIWLKESGDSNLTKGVVNNYDPTLFKPLQTYFLYNKAPIAAPDNQQMASPPLYSTLLDDSHYQQKVHYTYNAYGKVIEEQEDNGRNTPTAYVWGYNNLYPVAKVVGAHFSAVTGVLDTSALQSIQDDATMRNTLAALRTIPGALVTIYTYRPFVGISSVTDQNGHTAYYDYDKFYRLADVRDLNGNIIKTYQYNYKK